MEIVQNSLDTVLLYSEICHATDETDINTDSVLKELFQDFTSPPFEDEQQHQQLYQCNQQQHQLYQCDQQQQYQHEQQQVQVSDQFGFSTPVSCQEMTPSKALDSTENSSIKSMEFNYANAGINHIERSPYTGKGRMMHPENFTEYNAISDDDENSSCRSSDSSSSDDDDDDESEDENTSASSILSLDDEAMFAKKRRILIAREKPEKRSISAVMIKTIEPLTKDVQTSELPKGRWISNPYVHKYITPKKNDKVVETCKVIFDTLPPESDFIVVYDPALNLVSIDDFVKSYKIKNQFLQHKMVKTKYGEALKKLSTNYSIETCQYHRSIVNNSSLTPNTYNLVYGAVPDLTAFDYVSYILLKQYKFNKDEATAAPFIAEGELEIGAYCYTLLATLDLVKWKNDMNRAVLKKVLIHACGLIPDKGLRLKVLAFVNLKDPKYISAECMLLLKINYSTIISSLRKLKDKVGSKAAIDLWNCFMAKCGVHHYLCPHTLDEVYKGIKLIGKKLISKLEDLELQNCEYDLTGVKFSFDETKHLFSFMPNLNTSTTNSIKLVQKSLNSLYTHIVKMFADHLVDFGIYPSTNKICVNHVDGFIKLHAKLISNNAYNAKIPIMESKFTSVSNMIASKVQQRRSEFDLMKPVKMEKDALAALMYAINMIILKRVEILIFLEDREASVGMAMHNELQSLFESNEFTSIHNIEAWTRVDDDTAIDDDNEDENMETDDSSSDEEEEEEEENYENLHEEREQLVMDAHREYEQPKIEPVKKTLKRKLPDNDDDAADDADDDDDNEPKNKKKGSAKRLKSITARNYKQVMQNTPYIMKDGSISRISCAMCKRRKTLKAILIGDDIEVACCVNCHRALVIDYMSAERKFNHELIIQRISYQYKPPIAFNLDDEFIDDAEFDKTIARNVYNRKLKSKAELRKYTKPKKQTKPSAGTTTTTTTTTTNTTTKKMNHLDENTNGSIDED